MQWQGWFSLSLAVATLLVLSLTRLAPHLVMMTALTLLSVCGVLTVGEALAGFSNSGVITVAAMVVAAGIHSSGGESLGLFSITAIGIPVAEDAAAILSRNGAERRLVEAVVSPHCEAVGLAVRDSRFRDRYGAAILAVARNGERVLGNLGVHYLARG